MPDINDVNYQLTTAARIKFDPDDSQPDYIGLNSDPDASSSDGSWTIFYFVYSGSNTTEIRKKIGIWDSRVSLFI